jgi:PAS domain S-box-containing protein
MGEVTENWLYERIGRDADDAVVYADRAGIIRLWNRGATRLFGFTAGEALGQSLDIIIPEPQRQRHWDGYHRVMATGETGYSGRLLAAPASHRDGERRSTEFSMVIVRGDDGEILGVGAIMRDVTARWLTEKELRERLAALEKEVAR